MIKKNVLCTGCKQAGNGFGFPSAVEWPVRLERNKSVSTRLTESKRPRRPLTLIATCQMMLKNCESINTSKPCIVFTTGLKTLIYLFTFCVEGIALVTITGELIYIRLHLLENICMMSENLKWIIIRNAHVLMVNVTY